MLYQCLASVVEGWPTLLQLWVDALCLLRTYSSLAIEESIRFRFLYWSLFTHREVMSLKSPPIYVTSGLSLYRSMGDKYSKVANTRHWPIVVLMLGKRRRRWANIKPALGHCVVFTVFTVMLFIMFIARVRHVRSSLLVSGELSRNLKPNFICWGLLCPNDKIVLCRFCKCKQTAVTAWFSGKQLLLSRFAQKKQKKQLLLYAFSGRCSFQCYCFT